MKNGQNMALKGIAIRFSCTDELGIYPKCQSLSDGNTILNDYVIGCVKTLGED